MSVSEESAVRILIVDDDAAIRRALVASLRSCLEELPSVVLESADALSALDLLARQEVDLVLLDLRMPQMDGLELLRIVRTQWPDLPVLVVSGAGQMADAVQALKLGAWDYLTKPIADYELLKHAILRSLERARLARENRLWREHLEEEVGRRTAELETARADLERKNVALQELLQVIQVEKQKLGEDLCRNAELLMRPQLEALRRGLSAEQLEAVAHLERSLGEITSPFVTRIASRFGRLTPTEIRICALIRRGLASKEMARLENVSSATISVHRRNIRRKLGLTNNAINLASYIEALFDDQTPPA